MFNLGRNPEHVRENHTAIQSLKALSQMILNIPRATGVQLGQDAQEAEAFMKAKIDGLKLDNIAEDVASDPHLDPDQNTGRPQAASGAGAVSMVKQYSDLSAQHDFLVMAYAEMGDRLNSVEATAKAERDAREKSDQKLSKAIASITGLLMNVFGKARDGQDIYGTDEDSEEGTESDTRKRDEDDNTASSKASLKIFDAGKVPDVMRMISGVSKFGGGFGIQPAPDLSGTTGAMRKAAPVTMKAAITQACDAGELSDSERMSIMSLQNMHGAVKKDPTLTVQFQQRLNNASPRVRAIIEGAL